jgi:GH18 family chitinase
MAAQLACAVPNPDPILPASGGRLTLADTAPNWARDKPRGPSEPIVAASWYASSHSDDFTLQDVSWSKYTSLYYAFA